MEMTESVETLPTSNVQEEPPSTSETEMTENGNHETSTTESAPSDEPEPSPQEVFAPPQSLWNVSLSGARTTPKIARWLLPLCMLGCHALFYYGQTAPMWKLRAFAHIDAWANATEYKTRRAFDAVGLGYENHFGYDEDKDVQTFTYYFAIEHLWKAKGLPGKTLPRLAAVLLIVFSGIWPHLKLLWLNATWFFGKHPRFRTNTLHWLSTLGKWSLADVLVVCVMVGVLHLDWIVVPDDIKRLAPHVMAHRIIPAAGKPAQAIVEQLLATSPVV